MQKELKPNVDICIIVVFDIEVPSFMSAYVRMSALNDELYAEIDPSSPVNKYTVALKKDELAVEHLLLVRIGKSAKTIFYSRIIVVIVMGRSYLVCFNYLD